MGFLKRFFDKRHRNKQNAYEKNITLCNEIMASTLELDALFSDESKYIISVDVVKWKEKWRHLVSGETVAQSGSKKKTDQETKTFESIRVFQQSVSEIENMVKSHNDGYIAFRLENLKKMILPIEGKSLDDQQLACILKEGRNHIVVAGAGTGKTITVIGKIKFLLKAEKYKPEDILVLSFTNASATEMSQRIKKETGKSIDAMTFHKLGMRMITAVNGVKPNITRINMAAFVKESLNELVKDPVYLNKFIQYLYFYRIRQKSEFDFETQTEYKDYLVINQPRTMKNEVVKSYGEMEIANYLYKNGINYQYERPYQTDTATNEYARYVPDFYLPDADLYIEYYGIDRKGNVPSYFTAKANKTAKQTYRDSMVWKRRVHNENNTTLLELYAYEHMEGKLIEILEEKLKAENVIFNPKTDDELWDEIRKSHGSFFENLGQLFETVINLVKINNDPFDKVYELNRIHKGHQFRSNQRIIALIEPVFKAYQAQLRKNNEIDFNDMINLATNYVASGQYKHHYGYVIVDEYQDISRARYYLLKSMRNQTDFGLFCVGDDWQSIYGFAGSDISYILNFETYWGATEESKIETTYRFSKSLIDVSGQFVMKNPRQIKKKLSASPAGSSHPVNEFSLGLIEGYNEKSLVASLEETILELPQNSSVFFIGRYNRDVKLFEQSSFKCQYDNKTGKTGVSYNPRNDLKMEFLTAHRSKGLQADYVFILNNKEKSYGFPSKIQNDDVVQLLLEDAEDYLYSEERRLFYVAMTRSKKKAWLLVQSENKSIFVQELMAGFPNALRSNQLACPQCGRVLVKRSGAYGEFWGCSNYHKGCSYTRGIAEQKVSGPKPHRESVQQEVWKPSNLIGEKVTHATFGEGTIKSIDQRYVTVQYKVSARKFLYPDAFGTVLILTNPEQRLKVNDIVKQYENKFKKEDVQNKGINSKEIRKNTGTPVEKDKIISKPITTRNQDLDGVKTMKIGEIARIILRNRLENGHVDPDEIELMQTRDYSKEVFGIQFPLLLKTKNPSGDRPMRYYSEPLNIEGDYYYLCSEWYEVPANNDRPYLMKWLILH